MIKLTKPHSDGFIYVNPAEISRFQDGHYGHYPTTIRMKDGGTLEVQERSDEINKMIDADKEGNK